MVGMTIIGISKRELKVISTSEKTYDPSANLKKRIESYHVVYPNLEEWYAGISKRELKVKLPGGGGWNMMRSNLKKRIESF